MGDQPSGKPATSSSSGIHHPAWHVVAARPDDHGAVFVPDRPSRDEVEARKRQRAECAWLLTVPHSHSLCSRIDQHEVHLPGAQGNYVAKLHTLLACRWHDAMRCAFRCRIRRPPMR